MKSEGERERLSAEELLGIFNQPHDEGNFTLNLNAAREERAEDIIKKTK